MVPDRGQRVSIGGGAWIRFRPIGPDKAVITGESGRFMLLPIAEIDALVAGDPGGARRKKLGDLGFLLASSGDEPRAPVLSDDATAHVVRLREVGDAALPVVDGILDTVSSFVHLELCDADPLDTALVGQLVDHARARGRSEGKRLSIALRARLEGVTPDLARTLAKGRVALKCLVDGPPGADEISCSRSLHDAFSSAGVPPPLAFVVGVIPLDRAALIAGPGSVVAACRAAGLVFVELVRPADTRDGLSEEEHLDLYRAVVERILDVPQTASLLIEMGVALHLEALVAASSPSRAAPPPEPRRTIWGAAGRATIPDATGFGRGCAGCPYDPYCGTGILRDPLSLPSERRLGTSFCAASTGLFDTTLSLLASDAAPRLRTAFRAWMDAHHRVARHLSTPE